MALDYDLTSTSLTQVTNEQARYLQVEMQLDITINQRGVNFELVTGRTQDLLGQIGAPGTRLAYHSVEFDGP